MNINEKIRAARIDKGWTQKELAEALSVCESAVQKWETQKNGIGAEYLLPLSRIFDLSIERLLDDTKDVVLSGEIIELYTADPREHPLDTTPHVVYDANLKRGGKLHRFENRAGELYSAIYSGGKELFSCERAQEKQMILTWNETNA